jgi:hypothetical protein
MHPNGAGGLPVASFVDDQLNERSFAQGPALFGQLALTPTEWQTENALDDV